MYLFIYIVVDTFHCKDHQSDALQVAIELLVVTTRLYYYICGYYNVQTTSAIEKLRTFNTFSMSFFKI